jgi:alanine racemase
MPTILDYGSAKLFSSLSRRTLKVFVKIDVGLERLGVPSEVAVRFIKRLSAVPRLRLYGVYAHMHLGGEPLLSPYLQWQFRRFTTVVAQLRRAGIDPAITMLASTGVLAATSSRMNLKAIDPGLVFFGLDSQGPELARAGFRSAFHALKSRLVQVKQVRRSEFREVAPFPIHRSMRIGIIPIGRYDGMDGVCTGHVLVRGARAKILGAPYTEHTRIDLTSIPAARVGDEVVIVGKQGRREITPQTIGTRRGESSGGMVAMAVRASVPRIYLPPRPSRFSLDAVVHWRGGIKRGVRDGLS